MNLIAAATTDELRRVVVLLHVAGQRQRSLVPWHLPPSVIETAYPLLLAAFCVELTTELARRGDAVGPCPVCAAAVAAIAA